MLDICHSFRLSDLSPRLQKIPKFCQMKRQAEELDQVPLDEAGSAVHYEGDVAAG